MSERLIVKTPGAGMDGKDAHLYESPYRDVQVYVDGAQGFAVEGGIVKVNLFTRAWGPHTEFERRDLACRLMMPIEVFLSFADLMKNNAELIKAELAKLETGKSEK